MRELRGQRLANGTIFDHLGYWQAPRLVDLLSLPALDTPAALLLGQRSGQFGRKDMLLVEDWVPDEVTELKVKLVIPQVTINLVEDFKVVRKYQPVLPAELKNIVLCPNLRCISHAEQMPIRIKTGMGRMLFECFYCEHRFSQQEVRFV